MFRCATFSRQRRGALPIFFESFFCSDAHFNFLPLGYIDLANRLRIVTVEVSKNEWEAILVKLEAFLGMVGDFDLKVDEVAAVCEKAGYIDLANRLRIVTVEVSKNEWEAVFVKLEASSNDANELVDLADVVPVGATIIPAYNPTPMGDATDLNVRAAELRLTFDEAEGALVERAAKVARETTGRAKVTPRLDAAATKTTIRAKEPPRPDWMGSSHDLFKTAR